MTAFINIILIFLIWTLAGKIILLHLDNKFMILIGMSEEERNMMQDEKRNYFKWQNLKIFIIWPLYVLIILVGFHIYKNDENVRKEIRTRHYEILKLIKLKNKVKNIRVENAAEGEKDILEVLSKFKELSDNEDMPEEIKTRMQLAGSKAEEVKQLMESNLTKEQKNKEFEKIQKDFRKELNNIRESEGKNN